MIPQFYRGSEGALAVFDLTNLASFEHITNWIDEIHRHVPADLPIVLVGNKSDLAEKRQVSVQQAAELAGKLNISYLETSALNASNVEEAFTTLVTNIYYRKVPKPIDTNSHGKEPQPADSPPSKTPTVTIGVVPESFRVKDDKKPVKSKEGCC